MKKSVENRTRRWLELDPPLAQRVTLLINKCKTLYGKGAEGPQEKNLILACAPGRAEILGNHTDYNQGYTLSANITQSLLMIGAPRHDNVIQVMSLNQKGNVLRFTTESAEGILKQKVEHGIENAWANYIKGVIWSFKKKKLPVSGFNAVIQSTIPLGAGVSSSAAIELATAQLDAKLSRVIVTPQDLVTICKDAENKYVGVPCGYLDQGTIALADSGWLEIDYRPVGDRPFTFRNIDMDLSKLGYTLVVGYDQYSKHEIADGKYAFRQTACKKSIPVLKALLPDKEIKALRDISVEDFSGVRDQFIKHAGKTVTSFVKHVVHENNRVLQATVALKQENIDRFGELMTASGKSAIELYNLAEGAPELRFVYETVAASKKLWGVKGIRNMGGGFNATTLALVSTPEVEKYKNALGALYEQKYNRAYNFLDFVPAPAASILELSEIK